MTKFLKLCVLASGVSVLGFSAALANSSSFEVAQLEGNVQAQVNTDSRFEIFAPKVQTRTTRIDYDVFDDALQNVVLDFGDSLRQRAGRPRAESGTRFIRGHSSPYRLEGSRVMFSRLNDEFKNGLTAYRQDLENVASTVDIPSLSRDEQLAFWFNLHNVTMIEQIALNYPVKEPGNFKIKINGQKQPLDTAKILNIRGIPMSMSDIREKIVYPNWNDSKVMYGFFMGNIGGPRLERFSFKGENVNYILQTNANEFVNSLRGFNTSSKHHNISQLFERNAQFYFPNFREDVTRHIRRFASPDVAAELAQNKPFRVENHEEIVADLAGGEGVTALSKADSPYLSGDMVRLLQEANRKREIQQQRGLINNSRGVVIIEDLVPAEDKAPPTDGN